MSIYIFDTVEDYEKANLELKDGDMVKIKYPIFCDPTIESEYIIVEREEKIMKYTRLCDNCKRTFEVETKCDGNDCPHCGGNGITDNTEMVQELINKNKLVLKSFQQEIKNGIEVEIEE